MMSKPPYGQVEWPVTPGSGGGFFLKNNKDLSSGGGVINIQAKIIHAQKTKILSQGGSGTQDGGGGAGGSISVDFE